MRARAPIQALLASLALVASAASASAVAPAGPEFDGVDVKNKLGEKVDTNIPLIAPDGKVVTLANYLDGERPVVFTLNYYTCTSLCSVQLNMMVKTLKNMDWSPGKDSFKVVTLSFDPRDTTEIAAGKQKTYREELVRQLAAADDEELDQAEVERRAANVDWTFLVAREKAIMAMLDDVGYSVRRDERSGQYAHSPVTYILSPDGVISRYLWGLGEIEGQPTGIPSQLSPRNLKFALIDASDGNLGSFGDKLILSCFNYNSEYGGYEAFAWGFMRIGGGLVLVILATWLFVHWRRERRRSRANHAHNAKISLSESRS